MEFPYAHPFSDKYTQTHTHKYTGIKRNQHPGNYRKHSPPRCGLPLLMKSLFVVCLGFSYAAEIASAYEFFFLRIACLPPKKNPARDFDFPFVCQCLGSETHVVCESLRELARIKKGVESRNVMSCPQDITKSVYDDRG